MHVFRVFVLIFRRALDWARERLTGAEVMPLVGHGSLAVDRVDYVLHECLPAHDGITAAHSCELYFDGTRSQVCCCSTSPDSEPLTIS